MLNSNLYTHLSTRVHCSFSINKYFINTQKDRFSWKYILSIFSKEPIYHITLYFSSYISVVPILPAFFFFNSFIWPLQVSVGMCGFSCPMVCGVLVPQEGTEPVSLNWKTVLTTGPPGMSLLVYHFC